MIEMIAFYFIKQLKIILFFYKLIYTMDDIMTRYLFYMKKTYEPHLS